MASHNGPHGNGYDETADMRKMREEANSGEGVVPAQYMSTYEQMPPRLFCDGGPPETPRMAKTRQAWRERYQALCANAQNYLREKPLRVPVVDVVAPAKKYVRPSRAKAKLNIDQQSMRDRVDDDLPPRKKERYGKKEAAWLLDMSVSSLEYRARQKEITIKKDGGKRYVTQAEIDRYNKRDHHKLIRPIIRRSSGG